MKDKHNLIKYPVKKTIRIIVSGSRKEQNFEGKKEKDSWNKKETMLDRRFMELKS